MTFGAFLEYGGWIVVLWIAATGILQKFVKPFVLHPIRDYLRTPQQIDPETGDVTVWIWKVNWYANLYTFLTQAALFVAGLMVAGQWVYELDVFGRWPDAAPDFAMLFGLPYSPWYGAIVSCLVMVILGEILHDYYSEHGIELPLVSQKAKKAITRKAKVVPNA